MSQATRHSAGESAPTRRERTRAATVAEIKQLAWRQLAEVGPAALSLRGIASEMGMTSSALYRYFASRNDLLNELVVDGFSSLADAMEAAEAEVEANPQTNRWLHLAGAHRRWALEHPTEYALIYGTPVPGLESGSDERHAQMKRGVNVLFRCMMNALASGEFDASAMDATITPALRKRLQQWRAELGFNLPPAALAGCLFAWTQLHGAVSLELSGHLAPEFHPADELFDQQ
ncbi:MAG TPA: TetR/AcrR family transcriptional regulator, partial [Acidimicrobiales bacterium]|nr:TetR/AcrR family transcriptional regulator [Acidimicrobiales bacterium]